MTEAPRPSILLTFDVEEFDIPREHGLEVSPDEQMAVGRRGLERVLAVLDESDVTATLFTTASFAAAHPTLLRTAAARHEIASHGWQHTGFAAEDPIRSRDALERVTESPVVGFRMPRLAPIAPSALLEAGYRYDSSLNPTLIPGRYNALSAPRRPHRRDGLLVIPASVTPRLRIPLFWLSFKNFPERWYRRAAARTARLDGVLSLYFHPWEFTDLSSWALPRHVRRVDGERLVARLRRLLDHLASLGRFERMADFARRVGADES